MFRHNILMLRHIDRLQTYRVFLSLKKSNLHETFSLFCHKNSCSFTMNKNVIIVYSVINYLY